jgi:hypothetical protein
LWVVLSSPETLLHWKSTTQPQCFALRAVRLVGSESTVMCVLPLMVRPMTSRYDHMRLEEHSMRAITTGFRAGWAVGRGGGISSLPSCHLGRIFLPRGRPGNGTKHKTRAGGRECRCKQNAKTQAGGRVLIKQNTGHSSNRKPRTQRERERGRRVSCVVHRAWGGGDGDGEARGPKSP